jgi:hypothetical protein
MPLLQEENVCDSEDALGEEPPGDQGSRVQCHSQVPLGPESSVIPRYIRNLSPVLFPGTLGT